MAPPPPTFGDILFPTDFSDDAMAALPHAVAIAERFGGGLHLLHVLHDPVMLLPDAGLAAAPVTLDAGSPEAAELVEAARDRLDEITAADAVVTNRVVMLGATADEICRYATQQQIDLIVMGTHGRSGLLHMLLGSTAEKVVRHAPCPVLTVRPKRTTPAP